MLNGKSILHVNQGIGRIYSKLEITGYYNDLTEKVLRDEKHDSLEIPKFKLENGEVVVFPIAVFQYGLGSYDLYLIKKNELYKDKFRLMVDWAVNNQDESGAWNNFFYIYPDAPYSAMAQGEGASLLIRAYKEFGDDKYLVRAKKAIEFMLKSLETGGTTLYKGNDIFFQEFIHKPTVLNGWIFALFGIYDLVKISGDERLKQILRKTLTSLESNLSKFDNGYWSMYNTDGMITSPFYHDLHIAQVSVLYDLFEVETFKIYAERWKGYKNKSINRKHAFVKKALQKLYEK